MMDQIHSCEKQKVQLNVSPELITVPWRLSQGRPWNTRVTPHTLRRFSERCLKELTSPSTVRQTSRAVKHAHEVNGHTEEWMNEQINEFRLTIPYQYVWIIQYWRERLEKSPEGVSQQSKRWLHFSLRNPKMGSFEGNSMEVLFSLLPVQSNTASHRTDTNKDHHSLGKIPYWQLFP